MVASGKKDIKPISVTHEYAMYADAVKCTDEAYQILAEEIQKEIDKDVVAEMKKLYYVEQGWSVVEARVFDLEPMWMKENITGQWSMAGKYFFFEIQSDATLFSLRWM